MDDDPFDFKLGVDALRAKTESKLATALENARDDDAPPNGNVVDVEDVRALSSNHRQSDFSSAQKKKTNGDASASNADVRNEKRKETNDDAARGDDRVFQHGNESHPHDVGENAGTLRGVRVSCLEKREGSGTDGTRVARIHRQSNEERKR